MRNLTDILDRKLTAGFSSRELIESARKILGEYGVESYEREADRVRLAILKLAGADLEETKKYTKIAKVDYRDVLASAEYPHQSKAGTSRPELIRKDKEQYEKWLGE